MAVTRRVRFVESITGKSSNLIKDFVGELRIDVVGDLATLNKDLTLLRHF